MSDGETCGKHLLTAEGFESHLNINHGVSLEETDATISRCKIGKNFQGTFWCGFCKKIKPSEGRRNKAWDERFNHIGGHFKAGRVIDAWWTLRWNMRKGATPDIDSNHD